MNKKDKLAFDNMIQEAWNDNNAFCRKLKEYVGKHFSYVPELKERCKNPYWKEESIWKCKNCAWSNGKEDLKCRNNTCWNDKKQNDAI